MRWHHLAPSQQRRPAETNVGPDARELADSSGATNLSVQKLAKIFRYFPFHFHLLSLLSATESCIYVRL